MADLTGLNLTSPATDLTGIKTGPVTAGGTLTPEDAALQRDIQRAIFGDSGVYSRLAAHGIPLVDASGNMSPEAAYYANLAATETAATREKDLATQAQNQQRINLDAQRVRIEQERASGQNIAGYALGGASLATASSPLIKWLWERLGGTEGITPPSISQMPGDEALGAIGAPGLPDPFAGLSPENASIARLLVSQGVSEQEAIAAVSQGFTPSAEMAGGINLADVTSLADLSNSLQTPLDFGTTTGLTDMDALLSFLA